MKFLHMADVHLDSPFTLNDPSRSEARRKELRAAFGDVFEYIRTHDIPLCLIAGDIFESEYATSETIAFTIKYFAEASNCQFVVAPGNHDPYTKSGVYSTTDFPSNVHIFTSDTLSSFDFPELNTTVYGWAFTSSAHESNPLIGFKPKNKERINLLCAHADTTSALSHYCPVSEGDIASSELDYVALGHIHKQSVNVGDVAVPWAYCGCLVGRDYSESGHKGVLVADVNKGTPIDIKKIQISHNRYADETLDVTGATSTAEICTKIDQLKALKGYSSETLLRVTLQGSVSPSFTISEADIRARYMSLYSFEMRDRTTPNFDIETLREDQTIRGEFFRSLEGALTSGSEQDRAIAATALRYGLSAIDGNDFIDF